MLRVFFLSLGLIFAGWGHVLYSDGPYQGKITDKETNQPIEAPQYSPFGGKRLP